MEVMVALVLASIMLTLGFSGLNKARVSGGSRGLATAVAGEMRLAREKAIAKGSPVAVVFPQGVSRSLFLLEGDTLPVVTRTVNYEGDYPYGTITVATYPGPTFQQNLSMPGSKAASWEQNMDAWLPDEYKNCFVFMFIPNGSVITNDLPAADGAYRVICSTGAEVSSASAPSGTGHISGNDDVYYSLDAAGEPYTVALSASGAVESTAQLLGSTGGVVTGGAGNPVVSIPPAPEVDYDPEVPDLFHHRVTPPKQLVDDEWVHIINQGEYLTLETFAHSEDGRPLYAGWQDTPESAASRGEANLDDYKGSFSVPGGELERMEFYPEYDVYEDGRASVKNVWRSVWTWTPPKTAKPGDRYNLEVDVRDATKEVKAELPATIPVNVAPPGEIVFERKAPGSSRYHLYTMWANGSMLTQLTDGPHDYRYASATADGELIAFERDGHEVWVMNDDGTGQVKVAGISATWPAGVTAPTISPAGDSIAFTAIDTQRVWVKRLQGDGSGADSVPSRFTTAAGIGDTGNRIAYGATGRWIYYTAPDSDSIMASSVNFFGVDGVSLGAGADGDFVGNIANDAQVGGAYASRQGMIFYHADSADPYIGAYRSSNLDPTAGTLQTGPGSILRRVSVGQHEIFPAISPNQDLMLFCEAPAGGNFQIKKVPIGIWQNAGAGEALTTDGDNLRPAWMRQRRPF